MLFYCETNTQSGKKIEYNFALWEVKFGGFSNFFVEIILQVKKWRVKFGGFSAIPSYLYPPLFLPATILPVIIKRTKVYCYVHISLQIVDVRKLKNFYNSGFPDCLGFSDFRRQFEVLRTTPFESPDGESGDAVFDEREVSD